MIVNTIISIHSILSLEGHHIISTLLCALSGFQKNLSRGAELEFEREEGDIHSYCCVQLCILVNKFQVGQMPPNKNLPLFIKIHDVSIMIQMRVYIMYLGGHGF